MKKYSWLLGSGGCWPFVFLYKAWGAFFDALIHTACKPLPLIDFRVWKMCINDTYFDTYLPTPQKAKNHVVQ